MKSRLPDSILPLHHFIRKSQSINLFRNMLREARKLKEDHLRDTISQEIVSSFRRNKMVEDPISINGYLTEGYKHLKELKAMNNGISKETDSWMNYSEEDDIRGRVGMAWPWERK